MEELIAAFSLDRVSKSGARFQPEKARWFNAQYMHRKSDEEVGRLYRKIMSEHGIEVEKALSERIGSLIKERATFPSDFWELSFYFFMAPESYDEKNVRKFWKGDTPRHIAELRDMLAALPVFDMETVDREIHAWVERMGYPIGPIMNAFRLAVVGACKGPGMFDICEIVGQRECVERIDRALERLGNGDDKKED